MGVLQALRRPRRRLAQWKLQREVNKLAGPKLLQALARCKPEAFFVQVGANDGEMMDPIHQTVARTKWRGLVIEPVPRLFTQLSQNYASEADRVRPLNLAIADREGTLPFYHLINKNDLPALPDWAQGLGTFRKDVILKHADRLPGLERYLSMIEVPCLTWQALCDQELEQAIDLLLTDTEGYDFEIIRQIDFDQQRPVLMIYEHHHFDSTTREACIELLKSQGYLLFEEGLDTWALQAQPSDPDCLSIVAQWQGWVDASPYAKIIN